MCYFPNSCLSVWVSTWPWEVRAPCGQAWEDRAVGGSAGSSETPRSLWSCSAARSLSGSLRARVGGLPSSMWSAVIGRGDLVRTRWLGERGGPHTPRVPIGGRGEEWSGGEGRGVGLGLRLRSGLNDCVFLPNAVQETSWVPSERHAAMVPLSSVPFVVIC